MQSTRRDVLKGTLGTMAAMATGTSALHAVVVPARPPAKQLAPTAFDPLPLGTITPSGWLRRQLEVQANGMGGHLDEFWPDVGPNSGWLGGTGESWERGPYFIDGLLPLAWQLDDPILKAKAMKFVNWTLDHPQPNGLIGPTSNDDWWPRMVMLKVLMQYGDATAAAGTMDPRVIPLLTRYFHYQLEALPGRPLRDWGQYRWQDEALVVAWLYERTHDPKLLDLAALLQKQGFDWVANYANFKYTGVTTKAVLSSTAVGGNQPEGMQTHGVNNGQGLKTAAVRYRFNADPAEKANFNQGVAMLDKYHGVPNGMFSCDEHLGGLDPSHGTELCTVVETMFSMETALAAFGDPLVADRIEKIAYNALPGTFTDDMWAHQYDQQSNQVVVGLNSKPWTTNGPESNLYGLEPHFGCCTANFHQGWPKLTQSLWMRTHDNGLVAALYAPCELKTQLHGTPVHIAEETDYPFRETIRLTVTPDKPLAFPLTVRIPAWATGAKVLINGTASDAAVTPGSFARLERTWAPGDKVDITLPMQPRVSRWFHNAVAVERGPLVFSHDPGTTWVKLRDHGITADWQVFPTAPWNYGLLVDEHSTDSIAVLQHAVPARPFSAEAPAVELKVNAEVLPHWRSEDNVANPAPESPVTDGPRGAQTSLTLIPYAAAKLRITAFPQLVPEKERATT